MFSERATTSLFFVAGKCVAFLDLFSAFEDKPALVPLADFVDILLVLLEIEKFPLADDFAIATDLDL